MEENKGKPLKKVQILLSTYNGEKYLSEQLDSLLDQDYGNSSILIRDDGSTDGTMDIIRNYCEKSKRIQFYQGKNIGCWQSFMDLVNQSDKEASYVAFCDQDDVWKRNKLSAAVEKLNTKNQEVPLLYCGRYIPVNESLQPLKVTISNTGFRPSYGNAIIQDICTGCTAVVNRAAIEMAKGKRVSYMVQHDWWFYLIASCFGEVYYDEKAYILYRQHGNNEIGARTTRWEQLRFRLRTFSKRRGNIYRQLKEFDRLYEIKGENKKLIDLVLETEHNAKKRMEMVKNRAIYRQRVSDDLIYKVIILLGIS